MDKYEAIKAKDLKIDATRGKPNAQQVSLCDEMINTPLENFRAEDGTDVRNYGGNDGLPEMKRIFAELLDVNTNEVIVGGNSSLNMMFDFISTMIITGKWDASRAKFICPAPGYDRHFAVCEYFGIKMLPVSMTPSGPDMDAVEELARDPEVVGIWCVPVFSNPQGYIYSDETISRIASMKAAHPNFRIMWDDAYTVHNFSGERPAPLNILHECRKHDNESRPVIFTSFSKISVAGAGVVCLAAAGETLATIRKRISAQTIGPDKINQLRHARYFKNADGVIAHMKKHAEILRPKFECVINAFETHFPDTGATFTKPRGGYFVSVETPPGKAKQVRELCKAAGVLITDAGATFPYNNDPADTNLRFAPTFLSMDELEQALEVFCLAVKMAKG
ncbi:MAG: aminotransferase class I/II-fold pyridoxal phosphate-dependent enzyme [Defluviitaleaceae bacterium]|nr:aminotransferase class I/II-fold pyridoxal phosphate-dependent enzyme [Defluviitaleaceae bacterium]MCL2262866.1 aminotransferase class I/II-fold pyridoxal phosphate-dependent enzyme [Defluviitaleaceae bacterium]